MPTLKGTEVSLSLYNVSCIFSLLPQMPLFFIVHGWIPSGQTRISLQTSLRSGRELPKEIGSNSPSNMRSSSFKFLTFHELTQLQSFKQSTSGDCSRKRSVPFCLVQAKHSKSKKGNTQLTYFNRWFPKIFSPENFST